MDNSEKIGTVISTQETPNSNEFSFVIRNDSKVVKKNQFISVETEEGNVIARITDVLKTNKYFNRAESISEYEKEGKDIKEVFPTERWEYLIGEAKILGVWSDKNSSFERSSFPPSPGTKITLSNEDILSSFLGFDQEKGLEIGKVSSHNLSAKLNMTKLLQKHLAILSISGSGKSYLTSVLFEELLDRNPEDGQVATIVIDTHGEYSGFADDERYMGKTNLIKGKDFKIGVPSITSSQISEFLPKLSRAQRRELDRMFSEIRNEKRGSTYDLDDVLDKVKSDEKIKTSTQDVLISLLGRLKNTGFFGVSDNPNLNELAKPGQLTVLDVSDLLSFRKRQMLASYIARKLFNARRQEKVPPFLLVFEEAHNFAPENVSRENAISKGIIEKIAREGRKFNACLCLISQRPVNLSTTAISQCNTHIFLRITNPYDLDHIKKSSEGLTSDVLNTITSLRVGEALVVGGAVNYPVFLKVRERKSKESEMGTPLEEAARKYTENKEQDRKDAKSFM
ncbi:MAG: ATP-binding protein [Candidatus Aenigmatarchaeota archaeon]